MSLRFLRPIAGAGFALILTALPSGADLGTVPGYVGSEACRKCHDGKYRQWEETLHANVIKDAKKNPGAILGDFSLEELPFKREDVLYTIGSHWDQRYMTRIDGQLYVLPKLWSVQSRQWRPYNVWSWKQRPWSRYCAGCHVTGLVTPAGTYAEMRIGCESCHGPGQNHAAGGKMEDIVNPARLSQELGEMVCAACHVRGQDKSGQYYFPVGYVPGQDLGASYTPIDIEDGELPRNAIKRIYQQWSKQREESGRSKCEVCGIYGSSDKIKITDDVMKYCLKCHEFGNNISSHTKHREDTKLACLDCHRPKKFTPQKEKVDVHSVRYYRIHQDSCYDENIDQACIGCHTHKEKELRWATDQIADRWKVLPVINH